MTRSAAPALRPDRELVPRALVRAVALMVLAVLLMVTWARVTDRPLIATPPAGETVVSRDVRIAGDLSGAARVTALDGAPIADLSPEEGGFVAGVWRVIQRERARARADADGPVTLILQDTGRISIHDPSTGWSADLMGFGADNARAFARLLAQPEGGQ